MGLGKMGKIIAASALSMMANMVTAESAAASEHDEQTEYHGQAERMEKRAHHGGHVVAAMEASPHHIMGQGRYMESLRGGRFELGAALGLGANTRKEALASAELLAGVSGRVTQRIRIILEGAAGMEWSYGKEGDLKPTFKTGLLGQYFVRPGMKAFIGPYVGKIGHETQIGGMGGVAWDI